MTYLKTCPACGVEFETDNDKKVYCCVKCRRRAKYKPKPRVKECPICGKVFSPEKNSVKYCSDACRKIGYGRSKETNAVLLKRETRLCPVCGGEIPPPSANNKERKYCSRKCGKKANRDKSLLLPAPQKPKFKSIAEIDAEAKAAGMTFGEYVAKMRG